MKSSQALASLLVLTIFCFTMVFYLISLMNSRTSTSIRIVEKSNTDGIFDRYGIVSDEHQHKVKPDKNKDLSEDQIIQETRQPKPSPKENAMTGSVNFIKISRNPHRKPRAEEAVLKQKKANAKGVTATVVHPDYHDEDYNVLPEPILEEPTTETIFFFTPLPQPKSSMGADKLHSTIGDSIDKQKQNTNTQPEIPMDHFIAQVLSALHPSLLDHLTKPEQNPFSEIFQEFAKTAFDEILSNSEVLPTTRTESTKVDSPQTLTIERPATRPSL